MLVEEVLDIDALHIGALDMQVLILMHELAPMSISSIKAPPDFR
ncbi:hypothetical protein ACFS07_15910 [Undibacterium arcticum]